MVWYGQGQNYLPFKVLNSQEKWKINPTITIGSNVECRGEEIYLNTCLLETNTELGKRFMFRWNATWRS
jgi:hypothetical protein